MKQKLTILLSTLALSALWIQPANAERAYAFSLPINPVFFSPCALNGAGEFIDATGEIHIVLKGDAIPVSAGPLVLGETGLFIRAWNLIGYGRTTGNEYRLIDAVHEVAQAPGDGDAASWFFSVRANFIDTGPDGSHSQLNNTFRMVVVDGVPQVSLFSSTLECRGPA
jgi:hypothetical protein